jgi:hypothetical protein
LKRDGQTRDAVHVSLSCCVSIGFIGHDYRACVWVDR